MKNKLKKKQNRQNMTESWNQMDYILLAVWSSGYDKARRFYANNKDICMTYVCEWVCLCICLCVNVGYFYNKMHYVILTCFYLGISHFYLHKVECLKSKWHFLKLCVRTWLLVGLWREKWTHTHKTLNIHIVFWCTLFYIY